MAANGGMMRKRPAMLRLRTGDGDVWEMRARDLIRLLPGFALPVPVFYSKAVYDMVEEFEKKHTDFDYGEPGDAEMEAWDRSFITGVDIDTVGHLAMAALVLKNHDLLKVCYSTLVDKLESIGAAQICRILKIQEESAFILG